MGGKTKQTTNYNETRSTQVPGWLQTALSDMVGYGRDIGLGQFTPYPEYPVAEQDPLEAQAAQFLQDIGANFDPNTLTDLINTFSSQIQGTGLPTEQEVQGLMNPFDRNVTDLTIRDLEDLYQQNNVRLGQAAGARGATGGSRQAILEGSAFKDFMREAADTSLRGGQQSWESAYDKWFKSREGRRADAQTLANVAGQGNDTAIKYAGALSAAGSDKRKIEQAKKTFDLSEFMRAQYDDPAFRLNAFTQANSAYPYQTLTTNTKGDSTTTTKQSPGIAGFLGAGLSLLGMPGMGSIFGGSSGGLMAPTNLSMMSLGGLPAQYVGANVKKGGHIKSGRKYAGGGKVKRLAEVVQKYNQGGPMMFTLNPNAYTPPGQPSATPGMPPPQDGELARRSSTLTTGTTPMWTKLHQEDPNNPVFGNFTPPGPQVAPQGPPDLRTQIAERDQRVANGEPMTPLIRPNGSNQSLPMTMPFTANTGKGAVIGSAINQGYVYNPNINHVMRGRVGLDRNLPRHEFASISSYAEGGPIATNTDFSRSPGKLTKYDFAPYPQQANPIPASRPINSTSNKPLLTTMSDLIPYRAPYESPYVPLRSPFAYDSSGQPTIDAEGASYERREDFVKRQQEKQGMLNVIANRIAIARAQNRRPGRKPMFAKGGTVKDENQVEKYPFVAEVNGKLYPIDIPVGQFDNEADLNAYVKTVLSDTYKVKLDKKFKTKFNDNELAYFVRGKQGKSFKVERNPPAIKKNVGAVREKIKKLIKEGKGASVAELRERGLINEIEEQAWYQDIYTMTVKDEQGRTHKVDVPVNKGLPAPTQKDALKHINDNTLYDDKEAEEAPKDPYRHQPIKQQSYVDASATPEDKAESWIARNFGISPNKAGQNFNIWLANTRRSRDRSSEAYELEKKRLKQNRNLRGLAPFELSSYTEPQNFPINQENIKRDAKVPDKYFDLPERTKKQKEQAKKDAESRKLEMQERESRRVADKSNYWDNEDVFGSNRSATYADVDGSTSAEQRRTIARRTYEIATQGGMSDAGAKALVARGIYESQLNPGAYNPGNSGTPENSHGLLQLNTLPQGAVGTSVWERYQGSDWFEQNGVHTKEEFEQKLKDSYEFNVEAAVKYLTEVDPSPGVTQADNVRDAADALHGVWRSVMDQSRFDQSIDFVEGASGDFGEDPEEVKFREALANEDTSLASLLGTLDKTEKELTEEGKKEHGWRTEQAIREQSARYADQNEVWRGRKLAELEDFYQENVREPISKGADELWSWITQSPSEKGTPMPEEAKPIQLPIPGRESQEPAPRDMLPQDLELEMPYSVPDGLERMEPEGPRNLNEGAPDSDPLSFLWRMIGAPSARQSSEPPPQQPPPGISLPVVHSSKKEDKMSDEEYYSMYPERRQIKPSKTHDVTPRRKPAPSGYYYDKNGDLKKIPTPIRKGYADGGSISQSYMDHIINSLMGTDQQLTEEDKARMAQMEAQSEQERLHIEAMRRKLQAPAQPGYAGGGIIDSLSALLMGQQIQGQQGGEESLDDIIQRNAAAEGIEIGPNEALDNEYLNPPPQVDLPREPSSSLEEWDRTRNPMRQHSKYNDASGTRWTDPSEKYDPSQGTPGGSMDLGSLFQQGGGPNDILAMINDQDPQARTLARPKARGSAEKRKKGFMEEWFDSPLFKIGMAIMAGSGGDFGAIGKGFLEGAALEGEENELAHKKRLESLDRMRDEEKDRINAAYMQALTKAQDPAIREAQRKAEMEEKKEFYKWLMEQGKTTSLRDAASSGNQYTFEDAMTRLPAFQQALAEIVQTVQLQGGQATPEQQASIAFYEQEILKMQKKVQEGTGGNPINMQPTPAPQQQPSADPLDSLFGPGEGILPGE